MEWSSLIKPYRLGCPKDSFDGEKGRSEFHRDFDRIVFSSAFRRLNGKTQVVPFPDSDLTHTRLTHSLETASVARSLGNFVHDASVELHKIKYDVGALLAATCLCHDIGNPPLGHSGESAIQYFFETEGKTFLEELAEPQKADFLHFDGNSMGFHMLTHSYPYKTSAEGGLGLTYPVLSAYCKYPTCTSSFSKQNSDVASKKPGLFSGDCETYSGIADELGISKQDTGQRWFRHPLAFLAEAADDICNTIIDYEDGYKSKIIPFDSLQELFTAIAEKSDPNINLDGLKKINCDREKAGFLRAKAINSLIMKTVDLFQTHEEELLRGTFKGSFSDFFAPLASWEKIKKESLEKLYRNQQVLAKEVAGFEVIPGLLDIFLSAAKDPKISKHDKILHLLPPEIKKDFKTSRYETMIDITAYVCGMTDGFAVDTFRKLTGIQIPNY